MTIKTGASYNKCLDNSYLALEPQKDGHDHTKTSDKLLMYD